MINLNSIYCGECANIMREKFENDIIDLTVTSPPYDDLREYDGYIFDVHRIAEQLYRVTKPGGIVVWVVGDKTHEGNESLTSFKHALAFQAAGFSVETMIFEKAGVTHPSKWFYDQMFEYMFVFIKGTHPRVFNPIKDRENKWCGWSRWGKTTSRQPDGEIKEQKNDGHVIPPFGKRGNVWKYATGIGNTTKDKFAFEHPAMFPELLVHDHIISWTNEGDLVLDPMAGGGTTLKMAKLLKRNYIGIDISPKYVGCSEKRITSTTMPKRVNLTIKNVKNDMPFDGDSQILCNE
jgi:DNA modification methylase